MDETRSTCRPVPTAPKEGVLIRVGFHDRQETSQLLDRPLYDLVLPGPAALLDLRGGTIDGRASHRGGRHAGSW